MGCYGKVQCVYQGTQKVVIIIAATNVMWPKPFFFSFLCRVILESETFMSTIEDKDDLWDH